MLTGLFDLPWWGYVVYTLVTTHITIAAVTIYLHRHQAHRALELHGIASHLFRFWLWFTTGMVTREWAAIHRKHHAKCETTEDPHSPQRFGIHKVLFEGAELYRVESAKAQTLERYGHGTPDDWIEHRLYGRFTKLGIALLLIVDFILFGFIGITIWAVQMLWIPFMAAGVVNGIGHYWGYRTFQPADASRNIVPWGILIGGEELHNNHHAHVTSARLSSRWYEFDIGWLYIRVLEILGLARVKRIAPTLTVQRAATQCDVGTLQALVVHRYEVLAQYATALRVSCTAEMQSLKERGVVVSARALERWLHVDTSALPEEEHRQRARVIEASPVLATVYAMRDELAALWQRSAASKEQLVQCLEDWCRRADASGIAALHRFSLKLRSYRSVPCR
jgi:stearoyl-CoA desaturase (delta-9 desaturase)